MIRPVRLDDASAIAAIYNYYILHTVVTFEEVAISAEEMAERIRTVTARFPWLVLEEEGKIKGYAYAGEWKTRSAYKYTVESSVYLATAETGKGMGTALYEALFEKLQPLKIHAVIGGISLPNAASVALHEKMGFEKIGHFAAVGYKFDQWVDVGYWELLL